MESRRYVYLILLVLAVGIGVYYGTDWFEGSTVPVEPSPERSNDTSEQELSKFTLNENLAGGEIWKIRAPRASRSGDTVTLRSPRVAYTVDGDTRLTIVSDRGHYSMKSRRLTLTGNVRLERLQQNQVLLTDRLKWDRKARTVSTSEPVTLKMPRGTLTARGMKTHLKEETIQFLSNVKYTSR